MLSSDLIFQHFDGSNFLICPSKTFNARLYLVDLFFKLGPGVFNRVSGRVNKVGTANP